MKDSASSSPHFPRGLISVMLVLAIGLGMLAWGLNRWMAASPFPPERVTAVLLQTLRLRLWTLAGTGAVLGGLALWTAWRPSVWTRTAFWGALILALAALLRLVTPEMAFNSIVRPDGVHFSVTAQQLVTHGSLSVPTGQAVLPSRTLPGPSFWQAATQWIRPEHPGFGIFPIWLCAVLSIGLAFRLGRRMGGRQAGWAAALLVALSPALAWYSRQLMSEIPWGLLTLASAGLLATATRRPGRAVWAGLLCGAGLLIKSSHLLMILGLVAGLGLARLRRVPVRPTVWVALLAGLLAGAAPAFLYNQFVLGGWFRTAYHIYWPGWAAADTALNLRYLWAPPLINPFLGLGNLLYYPLAFLGLDPRPERMLLPPGLALFLAILIFRALCPTRHRLPPSALPPSAPTATDEARTFCAIAICVCSLYFVGCFLYSFQEPRFLLPVIPLLFTALAPVLARGWQSLSAPATRRLTAFAIPLTLAVLIALGVGIVAVEHDGRIPERRLLQELATAAAPYDILVSDEDPVLLSTFHVWTPHTRILPMLLPGELWFPPDPARLYRDQHVAVEPFPGTVPLLEKALADGLRVATYIRRPRTRPVAWNTLQNAFLLTPLHHPHLPWLCELTPRPVFQLGAEMPQNFTAVNRSVPLRPYTPPEPFELDLYEVTHHEFIQFLNDISSSLDIRPSPSGHDQIVYHAPTGNPLCTIRPDDPLSGIRFSGDLTSSAPFHLPTAPLLPMDRRPVTFVSWHGATLYCEWLNRLAPTNITIRLPSEAEWEWTATWDGSHKRIYVWGDSWAPEHANLLESPRPVPTNDIPLTLPVDAPPPWAPTDSLPPTPHLHLAGNVWEWCIDDFTNPDAPQTPTGLKILRGGSFRTEQAAAWAAFRGIATPDTMTGDIGFRVLRTPPATD